MENQTNIDEKVKQILADHLGVEISDIGNDDRIKEDLHISASDLTDIFEKLQNDGYNTSKIDISELETVTDILESLDHEVI